MDVLCILCYFIYIPMRATCKQLLEESGLSNMWHLDFYFSELITSCIFSLCPRTTKSSISGKFGFPAFFSIMEKRTEVKAQKQTRIYTMKLRYSGKKVLGMLLCNLTATRFPGFPTYPLVHSHSHGNSGNYSLTYWEGTMLGEGWSREMFLWSEIVQMLETMV